MKAPSGSPARVAAVDDQLGAVVDRALDPAGDAVAGVAGDDRTDVGSLFESRADLQLLRLGDEGRNDAVVGLADRDDHRTGHAALAGGAEAGADQAVDGRFDHRVGADDHVVLGSAEGLDTLAGLGGTFVDDLGDRGRADE